jgi:hypothetical protein
LKQTWLAGALTAAVALAIAGCGSTSTTSVDPSPVRCEVAASPSTSTISASGGTVTITVLTERECAWSAAPGANWLTRVTPATGQGSGELQVEVAPNSGAARSAIVTVAEQQLQVTQASGCAYAIQPSSQSFGAGGGTGSTTVTAGPGCTWTATPNVPWIAITAGASGTAGGTVSFTVQTNTTPARNGSITIGTQTFNVSQASGCATAVQPLAFTVPAAGGARTVNVTAGGGCTWGSSSNAPWMSITSGASGNGNGSVGFTVAATTGPQRTGSLAVAGQTVTVTQTSGCAFSINPTSSTFNNLGGTGTVNVTTSAGCSWTATVASGTTWISILSGDSGTGPGTVTYRVLPFIGGKRSSAITIAGITFMVTQS